MSCDHRCSPAHRRRLIAESVAQLVVGQRLESQESTEPEFSDNRVAVCERAACSGFVASVSGDGNLSPSRGHFLSMCDKVITIHDAPNPIMVAAIIPVTTAIVLPAMRAQTFFHH
jgi:hypothetical protein